MISPYFRHPYKVKVKVSDVVRGFSVNAPIIIVCIFSPPYSTRLVMDSNHWYNYFILCFSKAILSTTQSTKFISSS